MERLVMPSRVGADGVLQLRVPVGPAAAHQEVRITIEPMPAAAFEYGRIAAELRRMGRPMQATDIRVKVTIRPRAPSSYPLPHRMRERVG